MWCLLENIVLISHTIPISIYVAIEVLKFVQVHLVYTDDELLKDPMELDKKTMGLISETLAKNKKESYRNAVQITNTEIIENLG